MALKNLQIQLLSEKLQHNGWTILDNYQEDLTSLMASLCSFQGTPITNILYKTLTPTKSENSNSFNLSSAYGLSAFPLHSDGTHFKIPPRYFALRALTYSPTKTIFADAFLLKDNPNWAEIEQSNWEIKTIDAGKINTKIFNLYQGQEYVRYNNLAMNCISGDKIKLFSIIHSLPRKAIAWEANRTLIVDNWRMLHGRQPIKEDNYNLRILERIQIFV